MATSSGRDPANRLSELLGAMGVESRAQTARLARTEHNRFNLLVVHALVALLVPPLFYATQGSYQGSHWDIIRLLPGFPITFILPLWIGGLILLPATYARRRPMEMVGLVFIEIWYVAMGLGFGWPVTVWLAEAVEALAAGDPLPDGKPSLFQPLVYLHLAVIMHVHIITLMHMRRETRAQQQRDELL